MLQSQEEAIINEEKSKKIHEIADLDHDKMKFRYSVLNGLVVWEDFIVSKKHDLNNKFRSEFMSIFVITKGEGVMSINMEDSSIQENSMILVSPGTLVFLPSENQTFTASGVSFTIDFLSDIGMSERNGEFFNYFSSRYSPVWQIEPDDKAIIQDQVQLLSKRIEKYETHPYGKEILINGFRIFLMEIAALGQKYSEMTRFNFSRQESLVIKFSNLVKQQFRELRTVKKYADQLNVSAKYLTEVVKEYSGKNAGEIINDLVILEAKFLLLRTELSIGEIADTLHFSDQSFFGKYFKRQTGLSPKAFRETEFLSI